MTSNNPHRVIVRLPEQRGPAHDQADPKATTIINMLPSLLAQLSPPPVPEERRIALRERLLEAFERQYPKQALSPTADIRELEQPS